MYFYSLLWLFELEKLYFEAINKYTKVQYAGICEKDILKTGESCAW